MARVHGRLLAYVADEDESLVRILDIEGDPPKELGSVAVPGRPGRMLMLPGGRLAIVLTDRAEVVMYTPAPLADDALDLRCTLATPDEPVDLAMTPDKKTLLVVTDWSHTLAGYELDSGDPRFEVDLPRAPRAVLASADGRHAYVAHAVDEGCSGVGLPETSHAGRGRNGAGTHPLPQLGGRSRLE
jgi:DNA-binding beta-propeller fold protein YncE